jgi:two-component system invasion response regulator UvrY
MGAPTANEVAVLGVDDQPIFLDVAREVVAATPGFRWVGAADSGAAAVAEVERLDPALVLVDVHMPGMDGFETARQIAERRPDVVVVLVTMDVEPALTRAVESSGAAALIRKQELGRATLRRLWRTYARGEAPADPGADARD